MYRILREKNVDNLLNLVYFRSFIKTMINLIFFNRTILIFLYKLFLHNIRR